MDHVGTSAPTGNLSLRVVRRQEPVWDSCMDHSSLAGAIRTGLPQMGLPADVNAWRKANARNLWRGMRRAFTARAMGIAHHYGALGLVVFHADGSTTDLGLASMRLVTDTGVAFIVDAFQGILEPEIMKYHGFGTGTTAESAAQTALVTELTTQYATDNVRPTGSLAEGATGNIFRTVGTLSPDASAAITEHGVFSQAAVAGGTMIDRSVFSAVNLTSADSLQATYELTFTSGG